METPVKLNKERNLRVDTRTCSRSSSITGNLSPKLISPRDKKIKNFTLSPAIGTELERLKQTYTPVVEPVKVKVPPPEERPLKRSISINTAHRPANINTKFRSLGGKVTNLLRVRKAFQTTKKDENDFITSDKHLPKEPRFSSSLSPAAQYAMMKCYEDTVYTNLCKHYPASRLFLKRSKTPPRSFIDIGDVSRLIQAPISEDIPKADVNENGSEQLKEVKLDKYAENRRERRDRRLSTRFANPEQQSTSETSTQTLSKRRAMLSRTKSMPVVTQNLISREKRLILSHRLQSAMDILDTVRGNVGENSISPRINAYPRQIQPVSDFNQWSSIWSNEFKIKPVRYVSH